MATTAAAPHAPESRAGVGLGVLAFSTLGLAQWPARVVPAAPHP
ncbi:hypothetical protein [Deinococcus sp.]|nr:hypothetical protein [Deinococcus sp.]